MYAVSKQLLRLIIRSSDKLELEAAIETGMKKLNTASQEEQNMIFELIGSSFSCICTGDQVKYPAKILKTKTQVLDNNPMTVMKDIFAEKRDLSQNLTKVDVFNTTEH